MTLSLDIRIDPGQLARYTGDPNGPVMSYLTRIGNQISNASAVGCPVDKGYLRSSREVTVSPAESQITIAYRAHYARFVHDGTRFMAGRPFLTNAMRQVLGA